MKRKTTILFLCLMASAGFWIYSLHKFRQSKTQDLSIKFKITNPITTPNIVTGINIAEPTMPIVEIAPWFLDSVNHLTDSLRKEIRKYKNRPVKHDTVDAIDITVFPGFQDRLNLIDSLLRRDSTFKTNL